LTGQNQCYSCKFRKRERKKKNIDKVIRNKRRSLKEGVISYYHAAAVAEMRKEEVIEGYECIKDHAKMPYHF